MEEKQLRRKSPPRRLTSTMKTVGILGHSFHRKQIAKTASWLMIS